MGRQITAPKSKILIGDRQTQLRATHLTVLIMNIVGYGNQPATQLLIVGEGGN